MKNKIYLSVIIIFLIFCFVIFYNGLNSSNIYTPKINTKQKLPIFEAKDFYSNKSISSEELFKEDIFYIVNIWASWCVPCRKEHKFLMELSKSENVKIIGLNYKDNLNNAKKFINELGNPYSKNLTDKNGFLSIEFGAYGVPETFIINKNKTIVKKFIGPINKKILNQIMQIIK